MLNDPRSHGLWEMTAPAAPETNGLKGDVTADVVAIGAGYTGLSAALHLAEAGKSAVVLEANEIGFGGAGRNVGLVNAGLWMTPDDVNAALPGDYGRRILDLLGNGPKYVWEVIQKYGIACEATPAGTLHCAVGEAGLDELRDREKQWQALGAPVRLLDAAETAAKLGTTAYPGALLDLRAGTIQPLAYARGLAKAAIGAGATVYTGSAVTGIEQAGDGWRVTTAGGSVTAKWVIPAGDAFAVGPFAATRTEQVRLPYFNFATVPLSDNIRRAILPERQGVWDTKEILSSFRMDAAGRLVFGSVGALRNTGHAVHKAWSRRMLARIYPALADIEFEAEWYGWIGMTDDAVPRFHKFAPNVVGFNGYNGRGISPGTNFGRVLADLILGRIEEADLPLPLTDPKDASWRQIKEAYYEAGAQVAHFVEGRR
jgi:glycine/D-amino acid oxidase-like deaminating enzyme